MIVTAATRRFRDVRLVRSGAWHLGEALGRRDRLLTGQLLSGSRIALLSRDRQHRHIYFFGDHEPEVTYLLRKIVRPGMVVFDVGANAGYFTLLARDLGANVHAFEPNPHMHALLARSLEFDSSRITVVPCACSDAPGELDLYLQDATNSGMASLEKPTDDRLRVQATTLSDYWRDTGAVPDLIKIDVEGHEYRALLGAADLLDATHPDILLEHATDRLVEWLGQRGYLAPEVPDGDHVYFTA